MINPKIFISGKFQPSDLIISVSNSNRRIDTDCESKIDSIWGAKVEKAVREGKICYNGSLYRLNSIKKENNKIYLDFGKIDFKTAESLKTIPQYFNLPEEYFVKLCYNHATVKTSDDKYVMVELSGKSMNFNKIDFIGGIMEKNEKDKIEDIVFEALFDELKEEGCIDGKDIKETYLKMIYLGPKTGVGFHFEVILKLSSIDLLNRFQNENKDKDIKSLKLYSYEDYLSVLRNHPAKKQQMIAEIT